MHSTYVLHLTDILFSKFYGKVGVISNKNQILTVLTVICVAGKKSDNNEKFVPFFSFVKKDHKSTFLISKFRVYYVQSFHFLV